jgi:hypothetical protein
MRKLKLKAACSLLAGLAAFTGSAQAQTPPSEPSGPTTITEAIQQGTPILEFRPRYESVDQTGVAEAEAFTLRTRVGWQTARWNNLVGLIEFEDVRQLGGSDYNDGVPPAEPYATIADPDVTELNRLQLVWTPTSQLTATIGRQRIMLDDQRFIGAVAWRQDEQTFDAVRVDGDFGRLDATYAYLGHINRVFAEELDWRSDSHALNVGYTFADPLRVQVFAYLLDFTHPNTAAVAANSNQTFGVRATGKTWIERFQLAYAASYAQQSDYGDNLNDYEADYLAGELSLTWGPTTARIAYESLEGNGPQRRFQTPLATLHVFQGWADVFLNTPDDGIEDANFSINVRPRWRRNHLFNIDFTGRYHEFEAERTGADLGSEFDFSASASFTPRVSGIVKYADYDGPGGAFADRTKFWLGLEFRL